MDRTRQSSQQSTPAVYGPVAPEPSVDGSNAAALSQLASSSSDEALMTPLLSCAAEGMSCSSHDDVLAEAQERAEADAALASGDPFFAAAGDAMDWGWDVATNNITSGVVGMADVARNGAAPLTERGLGLMAGKVVSGRPDGFELFGQTPRGAPSPGLSVASGALSAAGLVAGSHSAGTLAGEYATGQLSSEEATLGALETGTGLASSAMGTFHAAATLLGKAGLGAIGTTAAATLGSFAAGVTAGRGIDGWVGEHLAEKHGGKASDWTISALAGDQYAEWLDW